MLAGIVGLGALLDARSNAIALTNLEAAGIGLLLLIVWVAIEVWIRARRTKWSVAGGTSVAVTSLGIAPRLAVLGAIGLLIYSRIPAGRSAAESSGVALLNGGATPTSSLPSPASTPAAAPAPAPLDREARSGRSLSAAPRSEPVSDLLAEARLTCLLGSSSQLPPGEVDFMPIGGGANARLHGPAGEQVLRFLSPVRFREHAGSITIINRFAMAPGSELAGRPVAALRGFTELWVPIVTVVYGSACARMRLLEVSVRLNGKDLWYGQWSYDVPFQNGPVFNVPLSDLHKRLP